jgi:hypothetical protein
VSAIFLCHGKSVKTDELAENCTNRPFDKVFVAQERVWELLKDVLAGEFPAQDARKPSAKISLVPVQVGWRAKRARGCRVGRVERDPPYSPEPSHGITLDLALGTIHRIQSLREQGVKVSKIAELCGVAECTVRQHCEKRDRSTRRRSSSAAL